MIKSLAAVGLATLQHTSTAQIHVTFELLLLVFATSSAMTGPRTQQIFQTCGYVNNDRTFD